MSEKNEIKFEDALSRLEQIVSKLESGQMPLEESMAAFEEGMKLKKLCEDKLSTAEKKIEKLVKNADGTHEWSDVTATMQQQPQ